MLTEEYQLKQLKEDCENYLVQEKHSLKSLMFADVLNLPRLRPACFEYAKTTLLARLKTEDEYSTMDKATLTKVLESKVEHLEDCIVKILKFVKSPDEVPKREMEKAFLKNCTDCQVSPCSSCPDLYMDLMDIFRHSVMRYIPSCFEH